MGFRVLQLSSFKILRFSNLVVRSWTLALFTLVVPSCAIWRISQASLATVHYLGPTRINFNLGTPRSEIPSHYPMVSHNPCDLSDLNKLRIEVTFKHKQRAPCFTTSVYYTMSIQLDLGP